MAIQPETIAGRKEHFRKKRAEFFATWITDENGIVHIPLRDGFEAVINESKKEVASDFLWRLKVQKRKNVTKYYAEASVIEELRETYGFYTSLHIVVFGPKNSKEVDHKDGNGLNCLDSNLRDATRSQNSSNRHYVNSTGYRGVVRQQRCVTNPFAAQIDYEGKNHYLGSFRTAMEAGIRYNIEAIRVFGEFAILNQIPGWEPESNKVSGENVSLCVP
jgi:hypothetical protein